MKIVIDTNIFVAAGFNPVSRSATILRAVADGKLDFVWNHPTRAETRAVLEQIPPLSWEKFKHLFKPDAEHAGSTDPDRYKQVHDDADRKFAALAAATDAVLISNDDDLLSVRDQLDVRVQTPREFRW